MVDWTAEFNALPEHIRTIGCAMEARTRIQQLKMEKGRLKRHYELSVHEVDEHIKNCETWLSRLTSLSSTEPRE